MTEQETINTSDSQGARMIYHETEHGVLYCGDCLEILPTLEVKADLVLTDPPYGIDIVDKFKNTLSSNTSMFNKSNGIVGNGAWDHSIPTKDIFDLILQSSLNQIIWGGNYFLEHLRNTRCMLVWDKMNGTNPMADAEIAWTSFTGSVRMFRMHHFSAGYELKQHPTQKPVALFEWCLSKYSKQGNLILDPFAGSGTTAIACIRLNLKYILIEKEEKYCEIAAKRIDAELDQTDLFRKEQ